MKIKEVARIIEANISAGSELLETEVDSAFGSDMMSDVLAFAKDQPVLLTGLNNPQAIRTALMMDMDCVIFVRGKIPTPEMINLAEQSQIALLSTTLTMYEASGRLYEAGLHR